MGNFIGTGISGGGGQRAGCGYSDEVILSYNNQQYYENNLVYAGTHFSAFQLSPGEGNPESALSANTVVLTPAILKIFRRGRPHGQNAGIWAGSPACGDRRIRQVSRSAATWTLTFWCL